MERLEFVLDTVAVESIVIARGKQTLDDSCFDCIGVNNLSFETVSPNIFAEKPSPLTLSALAHVSRFKVDDDIVVALIIYLKV